MEIIYRHGVRLTKSHYEKTALEVAIDNYEEMAKKHYSLSKKETGLLKKQREEQLKESLAHLKKERGNLKTISSVQAQLRDYRQKGMVAVTGKGKQRLDAANMMLTEGHHNKDLKTLESFMRAEATPKPTSYHTAHHILPGKGRWLQKPLSDARIHMHEYGIRINDPANGVYLVAVDCDTPHWSMPSSCGHKKYHTKAYEQFVSRRVLQLKNIDFIKIELQLIGRMLQENEPKDAIQQIKKRGI